MKTPQIFSILELQDSPDEMDRWISWTTLIEKFEKDIKKDILMDLLKYNGIIDKKELPIVGNKDFNHFRVLDIGYTDADGTWCSGSLVYFIVLKGFYEIQRIINEHHKCPLFF